ncbi:hypothetical protein glysoja_013385 [Glycine soja]|nr:hypothetical protein glysoja_013385 [Glycine soja]
MSPALQVAFRVCPRKRIEPASQARVLHRAPTFFSLPSSPPIGM